MEHQQREQHRATDPAAAPSGEESMRPHSTGHDRVDGVLQSLEALEQLPVEAHPPVYEAAQAALRRALDEVREDAPSAATA